MMITKIAVYLKDKFIHNVNKDLHNLNDENTKYVINDILDEITLIDVSSIKTENDICILKEYIDDNTYIINNIIKQFKTN